MTARYALSALRDRRLKVAELEDLNDPFELRSMQFRNAEYELNVDAFRRETARSHGFLCFSTTWSNVLMWSHYADRHKGICIGFEAQNRDQAFTRVTYREEIYPAPALADLNEKTMLQLMTTKSKDWSYEEEWRAFPTVNDPEWCESVNRSLQFVRFGDLLKVREVLFGFKCTAIDEECAKTLCASAKFRKLQLHPDKVRLL